MEDKGGAKISGAGELWVIERPYPQRNSGSECRMEGQPTSERDSVSPDRSQKDFGAAELLSNSVYLWACDESPSGIAPSRSDAYVAWVVLIIQMACYIQLIYISWGTPQLELPSTTEGRYSIVSVAVAMYLMTSIAAVDLTAGIALLIEGRTIRSIRQRGANVTVQEMNRVRWLQRKLVGLTLITSFGLLAAASITVLFKSSLEDVDLVVGAATVLFIADVDEKAMFVLNIIPSKWRLFCVLEVVGLSFALALLALRATGHMAEVRGDGHAGCILENDRIFGNGCDIYSWFFIIWIHPMSVTLVSLLLNTIVASPKRFFGKHVLESNLLQNWVFVFVLASWVLHHPIRFIFGVYDSFFEEFSFVIILCYVILLLWWGLFICLLRRGSGLSVASRRRSVQCCSWNTLIRLYSVPACISLVVIIVVTGACISYGLSYAFYRAFAAMEDVLQVLIRVWLIWAIVPRGDSVQDEANKTLVPAIEGEPGADDLPWFGFVRRFGKRLKLTTNLIYGWVQAEAIFEIKDMAFDIAGNIATHFAFYAIHLLAWIGVGICAASSNEKGVAFWTVATFLLFDVYDFIYYWGFAKVSSSVD